MKIIIFDTETTGLLSPEPSDKKIQPYMTEISAIKFEYDGENFKKIGEFNKLVKPPIPLPPQITKITGITDEALENEPCFLEIYTEMCEFFIGTKCLVGHNLFFDASILEYELKRHDLAARFPWPYKWFCTIDLSMPIKGKRIKLGDLYKMATGKTLKNAHRARNDVIATIECFNFLLSSGFLSKDDLK